MKKELEPTVEAAVLEYGIIEENGFYGIRVDSTTKHCTVSKTVHQVTADLPGAITLLNLLWKQGVSPVNLEEILKDMGVLTVDNR